MECPVETFIKDYLPFQPEQDDVAAFVAKATYNPEPTAEVAVPDVVDGVRPTRSTAAGGAPAALPRCRPDQVLESVNGGLRFIDYPGVIPTIASENTTYSYLQKIMNAIGTATVAGRSRNGLQYRGCPTIGIESETPGSDNLIDACIISSECVSPKGELDLKMSAVAVVFEYKLESNPMPEVSARVMICFAVLMTSSDHQQPSSCIRQRSDYE